MSECESCKTHIGENNKPAVDDVASADTVASDKDTLIKDLELELAQTKLALVESECRTQDLNHQLNATLLELSGKQNTWFQKTLTSIKEVTGKKESSQMKRDSSKDSIVNDN